jgi:hypothetical protein
LQWREATIFMILTVLLAGMSFGAISRRRVD